MHFYVNEGRYRITDILKSDLTVLFLNENIPNMLRIISFAIVSKVFLSELKNVLQDIVFRNSLK